MRHYKQLGGLLLAFVTILLLPCGIHAQENKVMGQMDFVPATKLEKGAGIWIDGQYMGHVSELKGDKKILLLPGQHEIVARATGYMDFEQKVTVEPGKALQLMIHLAKDPSAQYAKVTSEIKLHVEPDRAAVF